jgi:hypothetical protein
LFAFGMMTTRTLCDRLGLELPIVNGALVFATVRDPAPCHGLPGGRRRMNLSII